MRTAAAERRERIGPGLRWTAAGVLVLGLHIGVGWLLVGRAMLPHEPETAVPGIAIDLDPVAVPQDQTAPAPALPAGVPDDHEAAKDPPPADPPPEPDAAKADPAPPSPQPDPEPAPEPPTPGAVEPVPPPMPLPTTPDLPTSPQSDAVLTPPPRPVALSRPTVSRKIAPAQLLDHRGSDRAKRELRAARQRSADRAAAADQRPQQGAQEQERASASAGAVASWRGQLAAHLNRFKRAPAEGGAGTARVSFTVDRNGSVIGLHLAASSGNGALDAAALAMVERANPVPPPPDAMGNRVSLSVPVHFSGS